MIKVVFFVALSMFLFVPFAYTKDGFIMERIDEIEIHVSSHKIDAIQIDDEGNRLAKRYEAATASPKNTKEIPFRKIGKIWQITLNPRWSPTENIRKEFVSKKKKLPKTVPPGKNNPLGNIKLFISFNDDNSTLGIHGTNDPKSIGKRVTHGCNRLGKKDISELARIILEQNGYDADELFQKAQNNPKKSITLEIYDAPTVVHLRE